MFRFNSKYILIFVTAVIMGGCHLGKKPSQKQLPPPIVIVAPVSSKDITVTESYVGKVNAASKSAITARVNGFLEKKLVEEGDTVKKNQVIFTIEKSQYLSALKEAEARLAQAEANANNAILQKERGEALFASGSISKAKYDDITAAYKVAKSNVVSAKAAVDVAKLNLSYTDVITPVTGRVGLIIPNVGDTVGPASGVLTTIIAQDPMYVLFTVTEKQIQQLKLNYLDNDSSLEDLISKTELELIMVDGNTYPYKGKINFVDNKVGGSTDSTILRGEFPNPKNILTPGQTLTVKVLGSTKVKSLIVPQTAVVYDIGGRYVYTVNPDNTTKRVLVNVIGETFDKEGFIVKSILKEGDMIVVEGVQKIKGSAPVNAMTKEAYGYMMQQMSGAAKSQEGKK